MSLLGVEHKCEDNIYCFCKLEADKTSVYFIKYKSLLQKLLSGEIDVFRFYERRRELDSQRLSGEIMDIKTKNKDTKKKRVKKVGLRSSEELLAEMRNMQANNCWQIMSITKESENVLDAKKK